LIKKIAILVIALGFIPVCVYSQHVKHFSMATDFDLQLSFKKDQKFWAAGPTFNSVFHFDSKNALYAWFGFFSAGKFKNDLVAVAKQPATLPRQLNYRNTSRISLKEFSLGWRRYLKGDPAIKKGWSLYTNTGLGLMFGIARNTSQVVPDTTLYQVPVFNGGAKFKRLTVDLGIGVDFPLRGDFYYYAELRTWIPTTSYPSKHLLVNNDAPFVGMFCNGLRILF
jgi:hypothetical protein